MTKLSNGADDDIGIARSYIEYAKRCIDEDAHLANYMLRDLAMTKQADLDELSWSLHREGATKNDVLFLIAALEKHIETLEKGT